MPCVRVRVCVSVCSGLCHTAMERWFVFLLLVVWLVVGFWVFCFLSLSVGCVPLLCVAFVCVCCLCVVCLCVFVCVGVRVSVFRAWGRLTPSQECGTITLTRLYMTAGCLFAFVLWQCSRPPQKREPKLQVKPAWPVILVPGLACEIRACGSALYRFPYAGMENQNRMIIEGMPM